MNFQRLSDQQGHASGGPVEGLVAIIAAAREQQTEDIRLLPVSEITASVVTQDGEMASADAVSENAECHQARPETGCVEYVPQTGPQKHEVVGVLDFNELPRAVAVASLRLKSGFTAVSFQVIDEVVRSKGCVHYSSIPDDQAAATVISL